MHSRYDPEREAFRFVESEIGGSKPSHVVLLGPCLDYLTPAVRLILPGARIVAVQYSAIFDREAVGRADLTWVPDCGRSLDAFLDSALDEDAISGVAVLEWDAASRTFPDEALAARTAVKASLDRLASSTATVKASGRRWIANACAGFLLVERAWEPERSSVPVLVAAAGPSLRPSLLSLLATETAFATIAVSSALAACRSAGVEPDLVVSTDGGYWSRFHLYPLAAKPSALASPLTALPSSAIYRVSGLMPLDQGSFAEAELLPRLCPATAVPPHGTVSGTAIRLAARLSDGPIVVAGLDLASFGELEHARPHGFDALLEGRALRLAPLEAIAWARGLESTPLVLAERPWRSSRSLAAYASALSLDSRPLAGRLFRIGASPVALPGFADIHPAELLPLLGRSAAGPASIRLRALDLPPRRDREAFLGDRLAAWRALAAESAQGMRAGALPEGALVSELLRSIDIVDYAAARRAALSGGDPSRSAADLAASCDLFLSGLERRFAS